MMDLSWVYLVCLVITHVLTYLLGRGDGRAQKEAAWSEAQKAMAERDALLKEMEWLQPCSMCAHENGCQLFDPEEECTACENKCICYDCLFGDETHWKWHGVPDQEEAHE